MNALVNYGTDSDSEDDDISPTHKTTRPANTQAQTTTNNNEDQDDPILAALKDLQDFAASVSENNLEPSSSNTTTADATAAGSGEPMEQDQDELQFLSFLQEIDAIPNPDDVQPPPPPSPPPPPPPPSEAPLAINNIPPPPPSSSITIASPPPTTSASMTTTESIHQSVQNIYNRLYYISLLPSASTVAQDLERRLLEFAIRIVDWTKGGLEEAYFLGQDLADALAQEAAAATGDEGGSTPEGVVADLPDFGGIVGSMIQYMFRLEQMITPNGWMAVWDTEDEAYGFQHVRTVSCFFSRISRREHAEQKYLIILAMINMGSFRTNTTNLLKLVAVNVGLVLAGLPIHRVDHHFGPSCSSNIKACKATNNTNIQEQYQLELLFFGSNNNNNINSINLCNHYYSTSTESMGGTANDDYNNIQSSISRIRGNQQPRPITK